MCWTFDLDPEHAVADPRIHEQAEPDMVFVEENMPAKTTDALTADGLSSQDGSRTRRGERDQIEPGNLHGAFDPRKGGGAAATKLTHRDRKAYTQLELPHCDSCACRKLDLSAVQHQAHARTEHLRDEATATGAPRCDERSPMTSSRATPASSLAALIFFFHLGTYGFWEPDEARYGEIAREMLAIAQLHRAASELRPVRRKAAAALLADRVLDEPVRRQRVRGAIGQRARGTARRRSRLIIFAARAFDRRRAIMPPRCSPPRALCGDGASADHRHAADAR